ncbi:MAG TPA: O-antigen ligase family protein [Pyrinomonadaceae bacterium]|nr:O-antigen ligase family protein [Pyrinomonadaceae bacterium]
MTTVHKIINRIVFYVLLATIVVTAIPYGSVQPWWIALFECVTFVLAVLAIVDLWITKTGLPQGASVALPLVVFCLFLLFQSLPLFAAADSVIPGLRLSISADPFTTQQLAMKLLALMLAGLLLLRYANTEDRIRVVAYTVIGVGVASALFGLLRQSSGGPGWFFPLPKPERGFAQFVNRNHFGFLMEMTFGLALGMALRGARGYKRWALFLPTAVFLWVTLIVANSRGAILASLCQVLSLGVLVDPTRFLAARSGEESSRARFQTIGRWAIRGVLAVLLVAVVFVGVSWVGGERVTTNLELASTAYDYPELNLRENTRRKHIWAATWQMFKAHPIVGTGLGAYWIAITKYHDASGNFTPQEAHNDYLELLGSGGLAGCCLLGWFILRLGRHVRESAIQAGALSGPAFGALVGILGVLVHSFVDFGLHITANALLLTVLIFFLVQRPSDHIGGGIRRWRAQPNPS